MNTHKKIKEAKRTVRRPAGKPPTGVASKGITTEIHEKKNDAHKKRIPKALVIRSHGLTKEMLAGRGFSRLELNDVGLTPVKARRLGLKVDTKRKSKHQENIEQLKSYHQPKRPKS
jgi:ribosomal protein L13E